MEISFMKMMNVFLAGMLGFNVVATATSNDYSEYSKEGIDARSRHIQMELQERKELALAQNRMTLTQRDLIKSAKGQREILQAFKALPIEEQNNFLQDAYEGQRRISLAIDDLIAQSEVAEKNLEASGGTTYQLIIPASTAAFIVSFLSIPVMDNHRWRLLQKAELLVNGYQENSEDWASARHSDILRKQGKYTGPNAALIEKLIKRHNRVTWAMRGALANMTVAIVGGVAGAMIAIDKLEVSVPVNSAKGKLADAKADLANQMKIVELLKQYQQSE